MLNYTYLLLSTAALTVVTVVFSKFLTVGCISGVTILLLFVYVICSASADLLSNLIEFITGEE